MKALFIFTLLLLMPQAPPQTARDYYNEIYKVGGLDNFADGEVCFDDDPKLDTFFIFAQSKFMRDLMMMDGSFTKLSKPMQTQLKKDYLIVRGYNKGIAFDNNEFYDKDGASWLNEATGFIDKAKTRQMRIRLTINWETLRYKRSVEILDADSRFLSEVAHFGRCEDVSPAIRQHGAANLDPKPSQ
jgi:hypothetical protein